MSNKLIANAHFKFKMVIAQERLRQARYSFNVALIATAVAAGTSLVGGAFLLSGKLSEGTFTALSGIAASTGCAHLAKDANNRLDKIAKELMEEI